MSVTSADMETILSEKLEFARAEKADLKEQFVAVNSKIEQLSNVNKNRVPRESESELNELIKKLEDEHSITSLDNAGERAFMRQMDKLRQKKRDLVAYSKLKSELDGLKTDRNLLRQSMTEKEATIDELYQGLRRLKLANKAGCNSADITELKLTVEEGKVSRIVGKGGNTLKGIENSCGVSIEVDRMGGGLCIMGSKESVEAGLAAVMAIVETGIEEFSPPEDTLVCLMMDKAALVTELQNKYSVRIDVSRAKGVCRITGLIPAVAATKAEILAIDSTRTDIMIEPTALAVIIGKSGSNIMAMEEQYKVSIELNREANMIEISGRRLDVTNAAGKIKMLIEENKEVEEVIKLEKHVMLGCLVGPGGSIIRGLNRELNTRVDSEGKKEDQFHTLKIRGNYAKVSAAKDFILSLVRQYISETIILEISTDYMPLIMGKGGAGIKAIRSKFPEANIDVDESTIHIQSSSELARVGAQKEIESVIEANYIEKISLDEDCAIRLKSIKGAEIRQELLKELELKVSIDSDNKFVTLRGLRTNVSKGVEILKMFQSSCIVLKVNLEPGDFPILLKGGEQSLLKKFENEFSVEINNVRKDNQIVLCGTLEAVQRAKATIEKFLDGEDSPNSRIIQLDHRIFPALIGKAGGNVKKMEETYGVAFDVLKSRNLLRIRSEDTTKVQEACDGVEEFIYDLRVTESILLPDGALIQIKSSDLVKECADCFHVEMLIENGKKVVVKGLFPNVIPAITHLEQSLKNSLVCLIPIEQRHIDIFGNYFEENFKEISQKYDSTVDLDRIVKQIVITGPLTKAISAKSEACKVLCALFPTEVLTIEISHACQKELFSSEKSVRKLASESGARIALHRPSKIFHLCGSATSVAKAKELIDAKVKEWCDLHAAVEIEESMLPVIFGKGGANLNAWQKETKVAIDLNRASLKLELKAADKDTLSAALKVISERVEKLRKEHWQCQVSSDLFGYIIGKQGTTINKIREESGATVDLDPMQGIVKVRVNVFCCQYPLSSLRSYIHFCIPSVN